MDFNPDLLQIYLEKDLGTPIGALRAFAADSLKKSLLKKFVYPGQAPALHSAALERFESLNQQVQDFMISPSLLTSAVFLEWKRVLLDALYSGDLQSPRFSLASCFANGYCGPGASVGAENSLFFTKMFNSHLTTTTQRLYDHYAHSLGPRWRKAEEFRQLDYQVKIVPGSKMSSVPKDRTKNRTTCTEPILNMFYQLGMKASLESVLKDRFNIDLSTQPDLNKALAAQSSLSDHLATIDMKDASDSISVQLCHHLLPRALMDTLMLLRSGHTHVDKKLVPLAMISTMGNGFTFALMTLIFAALVRAIYNLAEVRTRNGVNFGVFGDDIVILSEHAGQLIDTLERVGLTVNVDKSYLSGPFRESCGGDFYLGHDVRGVYIKEMTHEPHVYSAFNRLHFWALSHGFDLPRTLAYLRSWAKFRPIPYHAGVEGGFIVTTRELTAPKRDRNGAIVFHHYAFNPVLLRFCGDRIRNHHGGLIAYLGGYIRDDAMNLRVSQNERNSRFIVVKSVTPCWDYITDADFTARDLSDSWSCILMPDQLL